MKRTENLLTGQVKGRPRRNDTIQTITTTYGRFSFSLGKNSISAVIGTLVNAN
jgi:hypothetical protein